MKHIPKATGDWQHCAGYAKKVLLTADDLHCEGALVQLVEIPPQTSVADHYHEHCTEVFHVLAGSGRFTIDGRSVQLEPGDTLTCEPGEIHSTYNDADEPFLYAVFKTNAVAGDLHWSRGQN